MTLREFVCRHCGHAVVVDPRLPPDYTPNTCTPCYEKIDLPKHRTVDAKIFAEAVKLCGLLGINPFERM